MFWLTKNVAGLPAHLKITPTSPYQEFTDHPTITKRNVQR